MMKWKLIASNLFFGKKKIYTLLPVLSIINYINRLIEHCIWMFAFGWAIYVYNITYSLPPIHLPAKIILSTKELDDKNRLQIVWLGIQTVTQYDQNYSVTHPQLQHNLVLSLLFRGFWLRVKLIQRKRSRIIWEVTLPLFHVITVVLV